ncbi:MAG: response regulator [Cyclobacteriaceae bacterium]
MFKYLLIDDEEVFNFIHTQVIQLQEPDAGIKEIRSSRNALQYVREVMYDPDLFPDVIFVDINIPEMNGFELMEEIEKLSPSFVKKPHIYMVTSSLFESDRKRAETFKSLTGFMEKPISTGDIEKVISRLKE